jgi:formate/nitrite transporter FocA (FNT family)
MRTEQQLANIVTRSTKDHQIEIARKYGIPSGVVAGATFGLGITMMFESGHSEEQIVEIARQIVGDLSASPGNRGAS